MAKFHQFSEKPHSLNLESPSYEYNAFLLTEGKNSQFLLILPPHTKFPIILECSQTLQERLLRAQEVAARGGGSKKACRKKDSVKTLLAFLWLEAKGLVFLRNKRLSNPKNAALATPDLQLRQRIISNHSIL